MEDKELDIMLSNVLKPSFSPDESLNMKLKEMLRGKDNDGTGGTGSQNSNMKVVKTAAKKTLKKNTSPVKAFIRAAIVILAIASIGTVGVYAANYFLKKTTVYDHGISVGNQEYVNDEELAEPWEDVSVTKEGTFEGGPDDLWDTKEVVITGGAYQNSYYTYSTYEKAIEDTCLDNIFMEPIGEPYSICYVETEELPGEAAGQILYKDYELDSTFNCNGKEVFVAQSKTDGVSSDSAYSVILNKTGNERTYISKSGIEFTLVDDVEAKQEGGTPDGIRTYVMLAYDDAKGYIAFDDMKDSEIHEILDKVVIPVTEGSDVTSEEASEEASE
ncbi:MAG: hypothetical protein J6O17_05120 [Eubacterium sp.]|nr:hypothetical protein [Eubacterium sp.]